MSILFFPGAAAELCAPVAAVEACAGGTWGSNSTSTSSTERVSGKPGASGLPSPEKPGGGCLGGCGTFGRFEAGSSSSRTSTPPAPAPGFLRSLYRATSSLWLASSPRMTESADPSLAATRNSLYLPLCPSRRKQAFTSRMKAANTSAALSSAEALRFLSSAASISDTAAALSSPKCSLRWIERAGRVSVKRAWARNRPPNASGTMSRRASEILNPRHSRVPVARSHR
mmetsp:Transcript_126073/g.356499  ORF Transcript_126073/g.356499 Transcript_126073/m.356499 type:complete len:228 (-) Transcript_126073:576-1259(-)